MCLIVEVDGQRRKRNVIDAELEQIIRDRAKTLQGLNARFLNLDQNKRVSPGEIEDRLSGHFLRLSVSIQEAAHGWGDDKFITDGIKVSMISARTMPAKAAITYIQEVAVKEASKLHKAWYLAELIRYKDAQNRAAV